LYGARVTHERGLHVPAAGVEVPIRDADAVRPVTVGTVLWAIAFVALLAIKPTLDDHDATWWLWVPVAGFVLGLAGIVATRRRRNRRTP
jgi:fatty acid desaturase